MRWVAVVAAGVLLASPSMAHAPTADELYDHCEATLDEGTAAILFEKQRADSLEQCVSQARAAYGLAAKDAALAACKA